MKGFNSKDRAESSIKPSTMTLGYKVELNLDYHCLESNEKGTTKLELDVRESNRNSNVGDLHVMVQDLLSAPACDLSILYQGKSLSDNQMPLGQLHFRDEDLLTVGFPAKIELSSMKELSSELKGFSDSISHYKNKFLDVSSGFIDDIKYEQAKETLRLLCLKLFPWKDPKTTARRHFFVQEGGLDDFVEVFRFSALEFKVVHAQSEEDPALNERLTFHNGRQKALNILCLRLLWNFGETRQDQQIVIQKHQVHKLVYNSLLVDPDKKFPFCANGQLSNVLSYINQEAIGCLAGLSEASNVVQEGIARNGLLVRKLLLMLDRRGHKAIVHYSVFSSQLAANILFNCSFNPQALKFLIMKGVHYKMMRVTQRLLDDRNGDLALRYFSVLFLARVRASPTDDLQDDGSAQTIDRIIDRFLRLHQPCEAIHWEHEHGCNWMTILPFVQLAYAGGMSCKCDDVTAMGNQLEPVTMETKTLECESCKGSKSTCTKTKKREILKSWCCEAALYEDLKISEVRSPLINPVDPCPCLKRLNTICGTPCHCPGSLSTQRLGLFSLQCVLAVAENWTLLAEESLLPFLITLSWQIRANERAMLQKVLNLYKKPYNPPSLQIIAKSVFIKGNGLRISDILL